MDKAWDAVSVSFDRFCLTAGIEAPGTMMEQDAAQACGACHARSDGRRGHRWGRTQGNIGFHAGKVAVERRNLIRVGGLKTCWTEPRGTASPQLWALQPGKEVRERENPLAKQGDKSVLHKPWGLGQVSEVREDAKFPSKIDIRLHAAMLPRSRNRARWGDGCW